MRDIAHQIIQAALQAVNPFQAVSTALKRDGNHLICADKMYNLDDYERVRVIGFGKASAPMAQAVHNLLLDKISDGFVIVKYRHTLVPTANITPIILLEAGHPVPDANSIKHTKSLISLLADTTERDLILCLISGGGSALLTYPVADISLADLQDLTEKLLASGASISELNIIRKHISQVKGGHLAALTEPARLISLILSDVAGDNLDIIASGPTSPDESTFADALTILEKYNLQSVTPTTILTHLQNGSLGKHPETPKPGNSHFEHVQNIIIANNRMALLSATKKAWELNLNAVYFTSFIEGEARHVAKEIGFLAKKLNDSGSTLFQKPMLLIFGGETTVTLDKPGLGGRNQELALAIAIEIQNQPNLLVTCFATDGNDGPTDAAGAFVDGQTIARAKDANLDPQAYLNNHNSYHFFQTLGDLIITGPTNTNVNDLILVLTW